MPQPTPAQSPADSSLSNPNDISNMFSDFCPESRWQIMPQTFYEYKFGLWDCRGCGATTANVAHDIVEAMDDQGRYVQLAQELGPISRGYFCDCLSGKTNRIVAAVVGACCV